MVFFQLLIQGCPADMEQPGRFGTVVARLFESLEEQRPFFLFFPQSGFLFFLEGDVKVQVGSGDPFLTADKHGTIGLVGNWVFD